MSPRVGDTLSRGVSFPHMVRTLILRTLGAHCRVPSITFFAVLLACGCTLAVDSNTAHANTGFEAQHATLRIAPMEPFEYAFFGASVASSGATFAVGAWGDSDVGRNTGAVYVFEVGEDGWAQTGRLVASDAIAGARFGHSVAMSETVILVGAIYDSERGFRSGSVYVFEWDGSLWQETAKLLPEDGKENMYFGSAVAIDGLTLLVGASGPSAGSAYVFERNSRGWKQIQRLAPQTSQSVQFGVSVDLSNDVAVIGSPRLAEGPVDEDGITGTGAAFVYERRGSDWHEVAGLQPREASAAQNFGLSVGVSDELVVVGSPDRIGRAYVYRRASSGWGLQASLASGVDGAEHFGVSVAVNGDLIAVGAPGSHSGSGATYIFQQHGNDWRNLAHFIITDPPERTGLGGAVAFGGDTIVSGATGDAGGGVAAGAAYAHSLVRPE